MTLKNNYIVNIKIIIIFTITIKLFAANNNEIEPSIDNPSIEITVAYRIDKCQYFLQSTNETTISPLPILYLLYVPTHLTIKELKQLVLERIDNEPDKLVFMDKNEKILSNDNDGINMKNNLLIQIYEI